MTEERVVKVARDKSQAVRRSLGRKRWSDKIPDD